MTTPPRPPPEDTAIAGLSKRLTLARLVLLWERVWRLAWPVPALLAGFVGLALFDVLPRLPGWLHAAVLAGFALALAFFSVRLCQLRLPSLAEARRRAEIDSGFPHRPLQSLVDPLAEGQDDPLSQALWAEQRERAKALARQTRLRWPSPGLAARDPWGLRFAPLLLLAISAAGAWRDAPARLERALEPHLASFGGPEPQLQVWITPPAYTHIAPILLERLPAGQRVSVPAGSKLLAELQGSTGRAKLGIDRDWRDFEALDADSQRLETTISAGSHLEIRQGFGRIGAWDLAVITDQPPSIAFTGPPEADHDGRLRLDVEAHDDYGVAKAWALLRRAGSPQSPPQIIDLPLGGGHPTEVHQAGWHDLTGNAWAGLAVTLEPVAEDDAHQQGFGPAIALTLPERPFTHPVARALIAQRRRLGQTPAPTEEVAQALAAIASDTNSYAGDLLTFLPLVDARARLILDTSPQAVPEVQDTLWQTALRLEEGDRAQSQRAVEEASRALDEALGNGASPEEIARLTDALETAMAQMLDALAKQAKRQGLADLPSDPNAKTVTPEELQDMLEQMRDLSRTGSREAAQAMLSQLREMMEGLRNSLQSPPSGEAAKQARKTLDDLAAITREQQSLLDDTFHTTQTARKPNSGHPDKAREATQESLRHRLGQAMQGMGELGAEPPDSLGQAEEAMRDSSGFLHQGQSEDAVDAQTEALARLQEGAKQAMEQLSKQMGSGTAQAPGPSPGHDPLGRPARGGAMDQNEVKIPKHSDTQKAREVLDELRRRSSQAERPAAERDYLQRLLKSFY